MKTYDINIDSYIGYPISRQYVSEKLARCKDKPVLVRVDSYGGVLADGLDIRQQFIDHGDVTVEIYGFTASAATLLCMGAKKVRMSRYALFLAHKVSSYVEEWGRYNADELRAVVSKMTRQGEELDKMDSVCASVYAAKCGKPAGELLKFLKEARWITAKEALDMGLVDELIEEGAEEPVTAAMREHFTAMGMPVPQRGKPSGRVAEEDGHTLMDKLMDKLDNLFINKQKNNNEMKKTVKTAAALCAALALTGKEVTFQDDVLALSSAQVDKLETHLSGLVSAKEEADRLRAEVSRLEKENKDLREGDGDHTGKVADTTEDDAAGESASDWYARHEDII